MFRAFLMELKKYLTNEVLSNKYGNSFELVNHAIAVADQMLKSDRRCRVPTQVKNRAYQVLLEVVEGRDSLESSPDDLPEHEPIEPSTEVA